jgi:hypothetical protein
VFREIGMILLYVRNRMHRGLACGTPTRTDDEIKKEISNLAVSDVDPSAAFSRVILM